MSFVGRPMAQAEPTALQPIQQVVNGSVLNPVCENTQLNQAHLLFSHSKDYCIYLKICSVLERLLPDARALI